MHAYCFLIDTVLRRFLMQPLKALGAIASRSRLMCLISRAEDFEGYSFFGVDGMNPKALAAVLVQSVIPRLFR